MFNGRVPSKDGAAAGTAAYNELDGGGEAETEDGEKDEEGAPENPGAPGPLGEGFDIVDESNTFVFHWV